MWDMLAIAPKMLINFTFIGARLVWTLLPSLINGLTLSWPSMVMACLSYLTDVILQGGRTVRISIASAMMIIGHGLALLFGLVYDHSDYILIYSVCLGLDLILFIYIVTVMRNSMPGQKPNEGQWGSTYMSRSISWCYSRRGCSGAWRTSWCGCAASSWL